MAVTFKIKDPFNTVAVDTAPFIGFRSYKVTGAVAAGGGGLGGSPSPVSRGRHSPVRIRCSAFACFRECPNDALDLDRAAGPVPWHGIGPGHVSRTIEPAAREHRTMRQVQRDDGSRGDAEAVPQDQAPVHAATLQRGAHGCDAGRPQDRGRPRAGDDALGPVPYWAKDLSIGAKQINARAETVSTKPAFKEAFQRRRCLVPADGFYEWKKDVKKKQPYRIIMADEGMFAFAGLWERWRSPAGDKVETFTIITGEPNELVRPLHDRMPVIIDPADFDLWLTGSTEEAQVLLKPFPSGGEGPCRLQRTTFP
jgi:putative SOS response-associated peptidase YedK